MVGGGDERERERERDELRERERERGRERRTNRQTDRQRDGGRDVVDDRERVVGVGPVRFVLYFSLCLLIHGSVDLIEEIILLCGGTE